MDQGFIGDFEQKIDGKGRVSIPVEFRRTLEASDPKWSTGSTPEFVIHHGNSRRKCLHCYTITAAEEVFRSIGRLPRGSKERRMLELNFMGQSQKFTVDDTGRIVLPIRLRKKIGLTDMAYFIATGDTFQIWDPDTFEGVMAPEMDAWLDEYPEDFDPLVLLEGVEGEPRAS